MNEIFWKTISEYPLSYISLFQSYLRSFCHILLSHFSAENSLLQNFSRSFYHSHSCSEDLALTKKLRNDNLHNTTSFTVIESDPTLFVALHW